MITRIASLCLHGALAFTLACSLGASSAALASPPPGGENPAHGAAAGEHGADAAAHGGEHHACFTCDDDHDGQANWLDGDSADYAASKLGFHAANLALFAGILFWFGLPAIRSGLQSRALVINKDLAEAARLKAEAEARHAEIAARLSSLEAEIGRIQDAASAAGQAEEQRLGERAREAAARVAETAERQIRDEAARARAEIRREAVERAVELAQVILRGQVQAADQRRLAQEFLDAVQASGQAE
jgi:F-type H+-transporting ATPase subunit b